MKRRKNMLSSADVRRPSCPLKKIKEDPVVAVQHIHDIGGEGGDAKPKSPQQKGKKSVEPGHHGHDLRIDHHAGPVIFPFSWTRDYDNRALLTRLQSRTRRINLNDGKIAVTFDHTVAPQSVKFFTRKEKISQGSLDWECNSYRIILTPQVVTNEVLFQKVLTDLCRTDFSHILCLEGSSWEQLWKRLETAEYTLDDDSHWGITNLDVHNSDCFPLNGLFYQMTLAFLENMKNGNARNFIGDLLKSIQDSARPNGIRNDVMRCHPPVLTESITGYVEFIASDDTINWSLGYAPNMLGYTPYMQSTRRSSSSSSLSRCSPSSGYHTHDNVKVSPKRQKVISDCVWYMSQYPGYFVLNIECRKCDREGEMECLSQMLTQMHFQSTAFGLVIGPMSWQLVVAQKQTSVIRVYRMLQNFWDEKDDMNKFSVDSFRTLCNWLYRIMDYRLKCLAG